MKFPSDDVLRAIVKMYARLRAGHGGAIGTPRLVQPTGEFFPDKFEGDLPSVTQMLRRMLALTPVADDLAVSVELRASTGQAHLGGVSGGTGGCGSPTCGDAGGDPELAPQVEDTGDGYRVFVSPADVPDSARLATSLARSVGAIVLYEASEEPEEVDGAASEIAAAVCGFGVLLLNGAAIYHKSCGGLQVTQASVLSPQEAAVVLALFLGVHGLPLFHARRYLGTTQREALDFAHAWTESNLPLARLLRDRPSDLEAGKFVIGPVRGIVGRWLNRKPATSTWRVRSPS